MFAEGFRLKLQLKLTSTVTSMSRYSLFTWPWHLGPLATLIYFYKGYVVSSLTPEA